LEAFAMLVVPNAVSLGILADLIAMTTGRFNACKVGLYINPIPLSVNTALADLTEATFHGYAQSAAVVWGTPFLDSAGNPTIVGANCQFTATTPFSDANTIQGYFVVDSAGTTLLWAEALPTPIAITAVGDAVVIVPAFVGISQTG
jgi:hypothetical protein